MSGQARDTGVDAAHRFHWSTITETLYALGASDRIVGIDITSTYPVSALREKKSVGYMRQLSSEGILSLKPDLILAMNDSGPANAIDQVMESSTPIVMLMQHRRSRVCATGC
ncbi:ABC transporter substrate-binding protein [Asaia platycodi]|uniref:ABC transporter substrate-binding protein n=1 Tax=Asaia platycodi TaxID=610243 RepID=UPI0006889DEF|nr:ABC transporter substrate-binding protein [Asaia platycodi]